MIQGPEIVTTERTSDDSELGGSRVVQRAHGNLDQQPTGPYLVTLISLSAGW
jgi:hypothetical protein